MKSWDKVYLTKKRYPVKADVLIEKIEGSYLIMLKDNGDFGVYLNELSVEIFDMCDGKHSVEDIINQIVNDYVVTYKECSNAEADITVDICNDNIEKVYLDLVQCAHLTHLWKKIDKIYIMLFADRGMYLDESPATRIWCLVGNASQKYWKLHIPHSADYSAEELKVEIENRPWLQRLFIAYCMNSNMAVLHGAFCNVNGEGCLFLGDSGVGKSTMCSILEREYHVYADDRIVIKSNNNQVWAYGTPWNIKNTKYCRNSEATVKKIYFLYHGNNIISDRIPEVEALKRIMKQILHSNLYHASELLMWKLVMAKILREHTTVYEFGFVPDNSCIKYIFGKNDE